MIALVTAALLAAAVQETGSIIRPRGEPAEPRGGPESGAEARRVMVAYSRCLVLRNRRGVERFLAVTPGSAGWNEAGARTATTDCLYSGQLRFDAALFRGTLYEAMYRNEFASRPARDLAAAPAIQYAADPASLDERQRGWLALQNFGDCIVRASGPAAHGLIVAEPGTAGEQQAFVALTPTFRGCLTAGVELRFSRALIRGLVAESLYRLTEQSPRAAGATR